MQCTTFGFFESLAVNRTAVTEAGEVTRLLLPGGLTPVQAADLYHTLFNCEVGELVLVHSTVGEVKLVNFQDKIFLFQVFFAPVIAIIVSYSKIFFVISR